MKRLNVRQLSSLGLALGVAGWACSSLAQSGAYAPVGAQTAPVPVNVAQANPPGPEYGRVLSSTAIQTQVNVPRQVCGTEQVIIPAQKSGAGAAMGAIAGGVVGNSMGQGSGRAVATAIGLMGGAILGDKIEGAPGAQAQNVERCVTQSTVEYRTTGYSVVYEYAGRQYSVQMPNDPGQWIKLQISPAAMQMPASPQSQYVTPATTTVVYAQPPTVVYAPAPVYGYVGSPMVIGTSFYYGGPYHRGPHTSVGVNFNYGGHRRWY